MDRLPAELIDHLHGLLDPLSSLRLALVSRQVAAHSHDALKLHQHRAQKYSALCDTDEKLAKEVLNDRTGAVGWHVRFLEFLDEGTEPTQGDDFENAEDDVNVASTLSLIDDENLYRMVWSVTGLDIALDLSDEVTRRDVLQTALLLSCPRVRILKAFRPRPSGVDEALQMTKFSPGGDSEPDRQYGASPPRSPSGRERADSSTNSYRNTCLSDIIAAIRQMPQPVWPSSLNSLRQFAIGMPSPRDRGRPILTSKRVLPLFLLPSLETVYMRGLTMTDYEEEKHAASGSSGFRDFSAIPARSSSVQHVCLEAVAGDRVEPVCNIISACRRLETLVLSSCNLASDFDQIPSMIKEHQALTLRTFLPCGDLSGLHGYRGEMFEERVDMKALKILPLCQDEIMMSFDLALSRADRPRQEAIAAESEKWEMEIHDPETIILHGTGSFIALQDQGQEGHGQDVDALDDILAGLVTAKSSSDRSESHSVYLDKVVDVVLSHGPMEPREAVFARTRQAGARCGVRIHYEEGALDRFAEGLCRGLFGVNLALDELF